VAKAKMVGEHLTQARNQLEVVRALCDFAMFLSFSGFYIEEKHCPFQFCMGLESV
jgi:hypothetical protein